MSRRGLAVAFALALGVALSPATVLAAPESDDSDLARIPPAAPPGQPAIPAPGGAQQTVYLENAFILSADRRGLAVPPPPSRAGSWEERLFLDGRKTWRLSPGLTLNLSGRLNLRAENDISFPSRETLRLDFREGYLSWTPTEGAYIDVGRINLRSGVALGANPTDFFKTRAVVGPLSADPSVLREDRLGAFMVRLQRVWSVAAVTIAYAPKLENQTPIYSNTNLPSLNPMFDRTNAHDRLLVKANANLAPDFSPEVLVYSEAGRTQIGVNLTESLGKAAVGYLEWAGGVRADLVHDALTYGRQTGVIPISAPAVLPDDPRRRFMNDVAVGVSYTTTSKIVFNLEYHYFEAGFSRATWRRWFAVGMAGGPSARAELWYIRSYAADKQAPASQQTAFLRADRQDAFVRNLELSGFVGLDLVDGSGLTQIAADYFVSDHATVGGLVTEAFGARRSDFGGSPQATLFLVKLARYF